MSYASLLDIANRTSGTASAGNQRDLSSLPGAAADCGQHAAGGVAERIVVGSINPYGIAQDDQIPAPRTPRGFKQGHNLSRQQLLEIEAIPCNADAIAYYANDGSAAYHFGRIESQQGHMSH